MNQKPVIRYSFGFIPDSKKLKKLVIPRFPRDFVNFQKVTSHKKVFRWVGVAHFLQGNLLSADLLCLSIYSIASASWIHTVVAS